MNRVVLALMLLVAGLPFTAKQLAAETLPPLAIDDSSFQCMLDMHKVRHFYVDNLYPEKLEETKAVAAAGQGTYPPGSVVQLVPAEVMVKHPPGYNAATKDWEFFELEVSPEGGTIGKRGFVDVVNRFGGNCFACHVKAKPEFDMICEQDHGCDPIPLTRDVIAVIQKTDPRCGNRYQPTAEEMEMLKSLSEMLSAGG